MMTPKDGKGFDASGKGLPVLKKLMKYGTLGSHGGWAHNWFSRSLKEGLITKEEAATIRMIEKVMRTRFISKYVKSWQISPMIIPA